MPSSKISCIESAYNYDDYINYITQNTKVIFFRPNLSAKGPVNVPKVEDEPNPAKNNKAIIFSANP